MEYLVNYQNWNSVFAVPASVVDNYIKLASGAALKVLLFVLRSNGKPFDKSDIANALGISEENVEEAFCFWEQVGIFSKCNSERKLLSDSFNNSETAENVPQESDKHCFTQRSSSGFPITPSEISSKIEHSSEIKALFSMAETCLGNMLTYTEQRSLIWVHEYIGLSVDVILMLLEYCITIDKTHMRYVEALAIVWQENEINTLEAAQAEIKHLQESRSFAGKVFSSFGIDRKPTKKQKQFLDMWMEKGYSLELIEYAYEKTIDSINKLSFPYINTILETWYENGLITINKVEEYNSNSPVKKYKSKNNSEQSYDINDLDSLAINLKRGE